MYRFYYNILNHNITKYSKKNIDLIFLLVYFEISHTS